MSKSSKEQIAKDESKVLAELQKNSNESIDTIAKHCRFSRQKTWRIIKHLENNKIIWGYTAIADEEANGFKHFVLLLKRNTVSIDASQKKEVVLEKLDDYIPGVLRIEDIFFTHGSFDAVVTFYAPNLISAKILSKNYLKESVNISKSILSLRLFFRFERRDLRILK